MTPTMMGTSVRQLDHAYCEPPQDTPTKKLHEEPMKRTPPSQSMFSNRCFRDRRSARRRITRGTVKKPTAQKGKLM